MKQSRFHIKSMKFVDPKTDIAFKKIFGNEAHKNVLIEFLNEMLELEYPIADVTITNSYQPPTSLAWKKPRWTSKRQTQPADNSLRQAPNLDHIPTNSSTAALQQAYQIAEQHGWTAEVEALN